MLANASRPSHEKHDKKQEEKKTVESSALKEYKKGGVLIPQNLDDYVSKQ
jgi:hypothetical protein